MTDSPTQPASWQTAADTFKLIMSGYDPITDKALDAFISNSPDISRLKAAARLLARQLDPVLITGPSGVGKELIARVLHWRPGEPFIPINCAALPETLLPSLLFGHVKGTFTGADNDKEGLFIKAGQGTVFLDEVGDMPLAQQPALLRVLQEREIIKLGGHTPQQINCRIIAATNAPEKLRDDLYARLSMIELNIPGLNSRPEDIELLRLHFNINPATILDADKLNKYNVRYLQAIAARQKYGL